MFIFGLLFHSHNISLKDFEHYEKEAIYSDLKLITKCFQLSEPYLF